MPLYEYECDACAHRFEVIQKSFSDAPISTCPKCGGAVRKLLSSPAIHFKGSGWYITDYARAGKSETASSTGNADSGSSTEKKTESKDKTDAKTESTGESKADSKSESKADSKSESKKSDTKPASSTPSTS